MSAWDSSGHRHGRWTGLFKLGEECGELAVAAADVLHLSATVVDMPEFVRALENELADVGAACRHAVEANRLDRDRIAARRLRRSASLAREIDRRRGWTGLIALMRGCGQMAQLLGKIAAFPNGEEHPDCGGNLAGRLEVAIAELVATATLVAESNRLDLDHIELRGDAKLEKFRAWFPAPASAEELQA